MSGPTRSDSGDADGPTPDDPSSESIEEYIPGFLLPAWERYQTFERFRENWAPAFVSYAEMALAVILTLGFVYWLYLFLVVA